MNKDLKCDVCGSEGLGLDWPSPHLCGQCGRQRDIKVKKTCPFCGLDATLGVRNNPDEEEAYWITCMVCHAQGPHARVQELAVWEWNRRNHDSFWSNYKTNKPEDL